MNKLYTPNGAVISSLYLKRCLAVILFLFCSYCIQAQITVIIPCNGTAGSYASGSVSSGGTKNEGNMLNLTNSANRGWAQFDLSAVPSGVTITGAKINFTTYSSSASGFPNVMRGFTGDPATMTGATLYSKCFTGDVGWDTLASSPWLANAPNSYNLLTKGVNFLQTYIGSKVCLTFVRPSSFPYNIYGPLGLGSTSGNIPTLEVTYVFPCTAIPAPGATVASENPVCSGGSTSLSMSGSPAGDGISYQWQSSTDGFSYAPVGGATSATLTVAPTVSTYYKCDVTCATYGTATSTPLQVVIGYSYPFLQNFSAVLFPPSCWTRNSTVYLIRDNANGYAATGQGSLKYLFYNGAGIPVGTILDFSSPTLPPSPANYELKFDFAYATFTGQNDQLVIKGSTTGGVSYSTLVTLDGGTSGPLNTAGSLSTTSFTPSTASQWNSYTLTLPTGTTNLIFEGIAAGGNNLLLDNIRIEAPPSIPPNCVASVTPIDGTTGVCPVPSLSWVDGGGGTTGYHVYFGTTPSPDYIGDQTSATFSPGVLDDLTTYYWKIVPYNGFGDAVGCIENSFTTGTSAVITSSADVTEVTSNGIVNYTTTTGSSYDWLYGFVSGGPYTSTGANLNPIGFKLTSVISQNFYVISKVTSGTCPAYSNEVATFVRCATPYSNSDPGTTEDAIGSVVFGGINNVQTAPWFNAGGGNWSDFTSLTPAAVCLGNDEDLTVEIPGTFNEGVAAWIDWNNDDDFDDVNELVMQVAPYLGTQTVSVHIPEDAEIATVRMRVISVYNATPDASACYAGTYGYGEIEEYLVAVVAPNTFYADADLDGFGDPVVSISSCDELAPSGYVGNNLDCDDANASVNPSATEVCNTIDDDCDGDIDDADPSVIGLSTWYEDADLDGFGNDITTAEACFVPSGYSPDNSDCNDGDASINPGASEACNGIDDNCDGSIDESITYDTYYADADEDGYGDASVSTYTCAPPSGYVLDNTDCNDGSALMNPGLSEVCDGLDNNCDGTVDEGLASASITVTGSTTFCKGSSVTLDANTGVDYTYQWRRNGNSLAGATASTYVATKDGNYDVQVTIPGGCFAVSSIVSVTRLAAPSPTITPQSSLDICALGFVKLKSNGGSSVSRQWYLDGSLIPGATGVLYTATATGSYTLVSRLISTGCATTSAPAVVYTTCRGSEGLGEEESVIHLYPNPTANTCMLDIEIPSAENTVADITATSVLGQEVLFMQAEITDGVLHTEITFENGIPAGMYFIKVSVNQVEYTANIILTR